MKNTTIIICYLICCIGCSIAPMSSNNTARTVGPGNIGFDFGNIASTYYSRMNFGISPNMDAGMVVEFGNYTTGGFVLKYAFTNNPTGLSWAMELGAGGGASDSSYTSLGNIFSLNMGGAFELYWNARIISQSLGAVDYDLNDDLGGYRFTALDTSYLYNAVGMNIMFNPNFGMGLYVIKLIGKDVENDVAPFGLSFFASM